MGVVYRLHTRWRVQDSSPGVQAGCGPHPIPYSICTMLFFPRGYSGKVAKITYEWSYTPGFLICLHDTDMDNITFKLQTNK